MAARGTMDPRAPRDAARTLKAAQRTMWALGDYHTFATSTIWELGPVLVEACGISRGQRVLDVATGTGNVAIRAAATGATVVASDLTPENFDAGRRAAREAGVELEWVEGDAEALPFDDGEFDVVTSCLGAMFAPDQRKVADELLRVCRPSGTIGMINFTPQGKGGEFSRVVAPYMPPPPAGVAPPVLWGDEEHVRRLFGALVDRLVMTKREYIEAAESPSAYLSLFKRKFGPLVAVYASLADQPERAAALDREFLDFARRSPRGAPGDRVEIPYEYLLIVAHKHV